MHSTSLEEMSGRLGFLGGMWGNGGKFEPNADPNNQQTGENASTNPYEIDYQDKRFTDVEDEKNKALTDIDATYGEMIGKSDDFYNEQIQASKEWEEQQKKSQQEQTDFTIEQIEQQKEQAEKDYRKEQSGAFRDWKNQSNQYGVNAEQMAAQGMGGTGYSESSQLAMYNTYQYRFVAAREAFTRATMDFDNDIKEAQLHNNSVMAQIAFDSYQKRLELALAGFQYNNQLLIEQSNKKLEVESLYYQRWQDVLAQMNSENSLAEQIRQFNESMALEREQFEWQKQQQGMGAYGGSGGGDYSSSSDGGGSMASNTKKSLENMGLGGISASQAAKLAANGNISVTPSPVNGEPIYSSNTSKGPANDTSAYWSTKK